MAFIKIVKLSELGKTWLPQDHIPESKLAELLEERNRKVVHIDTHLKKLCELDDQINEIRQQIKKGDADDAEFRTDLRGGAEATNRSTVK